MRDDLYIKESELRKAAQFVDKELDVRVIESFDNSCKYHIIHPKATSELSLFVDHSKCIVTVMLADMDILGYEWQYIANYMGLTDRPRFVCGFGTLKLTYKWSYHNDAADKD